MEYWSNVKKYDNFDLFWAPIISYIVSDTSAVS